MKKTILMMLAAAVLMFSGCSRSGKDNVIMIGWFGSLTGEQAVWGENELNTVKLLFDEYNLHGGIEVGGKNYKLEVIGYDNKGDPQEAVNVVKRLTGQDKVVAIIGPNSSDSAIPIASVLEKAKVPDIATAATNPKVTVIGGKVKPYNFSVCFTDSYQGAIAAGFAYDVLKSRRAAIIHNESSVYSRDLREFFAADFKKRGGDVVADVSFNDSEVDFKPQLSKIKAAKPDIIFLPFYTKEVALAANTARALGMRQTLLGGDGWPSDQFIAMGGKALDGSFFVNYLDYTDPTAMDFAAKYRTKYGKETELNGYLTHDAVVALVAAIKKAGKPDGQAIAKALNGIEIEGITGTIHISPDTHNPEKKDASIIEILAGKYQFKQKYTAEQ
jgi:branched-chain amino acid transport system substrate-binding protein